MYKKYTMYSHSFIYVIDVYLHHFKLFSKYRKGHAVLKNLLRIVNIHQFNPHLRHSSSQERFDLQEVLKSNLEQILF